MGNRIPSSKIPVANPGRSGVFLFPNASTFNVPAFPLSQDRPGRSTSVGHVFPFPFPWSGRPGRFTTPLTWPTAVRYSCAKGPTSVRPSDLAGRPIPFPTADPGDPGPDSWIAILVRPSYPFPCGRPRRSTPWQTWPTADDVLDPGRRRSTTPDGRSDGRRRPTTTPVGRRSAEIEMAVYESKASN